MYLSAEEISARVQELGAEIAADYVGREPVLVCALKASFMFLADLSRALPIVHRMDFVELAGYGGRSTGGASAVRLLKDLDADILDRDVLLVEDVVDTGLTLTYLQQVLSARQPRHLRTACVLSKPSRRKGAVDVEYGGFTIEDRFVVGSGLDYAEAYRALPFIGVMET